MSRRRRLVLATLGVLVAVATPAAAHGAGLSGAANRSLEVPTWLFLTTGGGVIGASFLLASFVTDRSFIRRIHGWRRGGTLPLRRAAQATRLAGVVSLALVLAVGVVGPREATRNGAVLVVWVGWWSGFTMTTYLVGNTWPALNPFRTVASALPTLGWDYPDRLDAWPSVVGLLALIWLEVVSPVADRPRFLAGVVAAYTAVTVAGAVAFGPETWFRRVDPIARVFRYFGRLAPLYDDGDGVRLRLPGVGLDEPKLVTSRAEVAFVVAILWATTYDGLVATPLWRRFAVAVVERGVPAALLYPAALAVGYLVVLGVYALAVWYSKRHARTYLPADALARRFAPPLLAIAAGYHLAHFLGYFLELSPALGSAVIAPLNPPEPVALVLPGWFGGVELGAVILGHLLAIWVAHAAAYDAFPGKLQAIRSQYAVTLAMVCYTMASLWIVSQPYAVPPYVS